jgi:FemAB-related protein (PEP-CTERM system-associated)
MTGSSSQSLANGANSATRVCRLTKEYIPAWDNYVRASPDSTIYHLLGLKEAIEETYNAKTIYLLALNDSKDAVGVLPLVSLRFPWVTDALVSLPYSAYGGALANSDSVVLALLREAESIRIGMGLGSLLTKGLSRTNFEAFTDERIHYSMILDTNRSFEDIWRNSFTPSCRNHCNKAARLGVRIELGHDDKTLRDFYGLYVDQQHRHGSPMHGISWFRQLRRHLGHHVLFAVAYLGEDPIVSVCALMYRNRMITNNGGRKAAFSSSGANNLLQCELIRHACASVVEVFDFARSEFGSGAYQFKWSFGARPIRTYYQYAVSPGRRRPTTEPSDPRYKLPVEVWKRLPRFLVRRVGPTIRKHLAT